MMKMLQDELMLAKIGLGTAENGPWLVWITNQRRTPTPLFFTVGQTNIHGHLVVGVGVLVVLLARGLARDRAADEQGERRAEEAV